MLRYLPNVSQMLEELARKDDGIAGQCLNFIMNKTLADRLWSPFKNIVFSPWTTLAVVAILYLVIFLIYLPLWLISLILTSYGSYLVLVICINWVARLLARTIAFAGSTNAVQKEMSVDFIKRITTHLETVASVTASFSATVMLIESGRIPVSGSGSGRASLGIGSPAGGGGGGGGGGTQNVERQYAEVLRITSNLPAIASGMMAAMEHITQKQSATPGELLTISHLCTALESMNLKVSELAMVATPILRANGGRFVSHANNYLNTSDNNNAGSSLFRSPGQSIGGRNPSTTRSRYNVLLVAAGHALKASENLRDAAAAARPVQSEDDGYLSKAKAMLGLNTALNGAEKMSFPYMSAQLKLRMAAQRFSLKGANGNIIEGVVIPSQLSLPIQSSASVSPQQQHLLNARAVHAPGSSSSSSSSPSTPSPSMSHNAANSDLLGTDVTPPSKTYVLYCCPNAGYYECTAQMDPASSWVGFYTALGFEFCIFNYRGYTESTGSPSPDAVKSDAMVVAHYLKHTLRAAKIIVHGESIGGMVAAHVARTCGPTMIDCLVCDRTFASLDATAARLLGSWAAYGLKYIGLWSTDVVRDYLAASCPKAIIQDPDDFIISHASSLQIGVATRLVLGDSSWLPRSIPQGYRLSEYLKSVMPNVDKEEQMLREAADGQRLFLSEKFVVHFYACLREVSKKASLRRRSAMDDRSSVAARESGSGGQKIARAIAGGGLSSLSATEPPTRTTTAAATGTAGTATRMKGRSAIASLVNVSLPPSHRPAASLSESSPVKTNTGSSPAGGYEERELSRIDLEAAVSPPMSPASLGGLGGASGRIMELDYSEDDDPFGGGIDSDMEDDFDTASVHSPMLPASSSSHINHHHHDDDDVDVDGDGDSVSDRRSSSGIRGNRRSSGGLSTTSNSSGCSVGTGGGRGGGGPVLSSPAERLRYLCTLSLHDSSLSAHTKVWIALARADGGCGQLLGQALSHKGLDGVRGWVCSLIIWSVRAMDDSHSLPQGRSTVARAISDLALLIEQLHPSELMEDHSVQFLRKALVCISQRVARQKVLLAETTTATARKSGAQTVTGDPWALSQGMDAATRDHSLGLLVSSSSNSSGSSAGGSSGIGNNDGEKGGGGGGGAEAGGVDTNGGQGSPRSITSGPIDIQHLQDQLLRSSTLCCHSVSHFAHRGRVLVMESMRSGLAAARATHEAHAGAARVGLAGLEGCACHICRTEDALCYSSRSDGGMMIGRGGGARAGGMGRFGVGGDYASSSSDSGMNHCSVSVGLFIPVHCGHNGWPSSHSTDGLKNFLIQQRLYIPPPNSSSTARHTT